MSLDMGAVGLSIVGLSMVVSLVFWEEFKRPKEIYGARSLKDLIERTGERGWFYWLWYPVRKCIRKKCGAIRKIISISFLLGVHVLGAFGNHLFVEANNVIWAGVDYASVETWLGRFLAAEAGFVGVTLTAIIFFLQSLGRTEGLNESAYSLVIEDINIRSRVLCVFCLLGVSAGSYVFAEMAPQAWYASGLGVAAVSGVNSILLVYIVYQLVIDVIELGGEGRVREVMRKRLLREGRISVEDNQRRDRAESIWTAKVNRGDSLAILNQSVYAWSTSQQAKAGEGAQDIYLDAPDRDVRISDIDLYWIHRAEHEVEKAREHSDSCKLGITAAYGQKILAGSRIRVGVLTGDLSPLLQRTLSNYLGRAFETEPVLQLSPVEAMRFFSSSLERSVQESIRPQWEQDIRQLRLYTNEILSRREDLVENRTVKYFRYWKRQKHTALDALVVGIPEMWATVVSAKNEELLNFFLSDWRLQVADVMEKRDRLVMEAYRLAFREMAETLCQQEINAYVFQQLCLQLQILLSGATRALLLRIDNPDQKDEAKQFFELNDPEMVRELRELRRTILDALSLWQELLFAVVDASLIHAMRMVRESWIYQDNDLSTHTMSFRLRCGGQYDDVDEDTCNLIQARLSPLFDHQPAIQYSVLQRIAFNFMNGKCNMETARSLIGAMGLPKSPLQLPGLFGDFLSIPNWLSNSHQDDYTPVPRLEISHQSVTPADWVKLYIVLCLLQTYEHEEETQSRWAIYRSRVATIFSRSAHLDAYNFSPRDVKKMEKEFNTSNHPLPLAREMHQQVANFQRWAPDPLSEDQYVIRAEKIFESHKRILDWVAETHGST